MLRIVTQQLLQQQNIRPLASAAPSLQFSFKTQHFQQYDLDYFLKNILILSNYVVDPECFFSDLDPDPVSDPK